MPFSCRGDNLSLTHASFDARRRAQAALKARRDEPFISCRQALSFPFMPSASGTIAIDSLLPQQLSLPAISLLSSATDIFVEDTIAEALLISLPAP